MIDEAKLLKNIEDFLAKEYYGYKYDTKETQLVEGAIIEIECLIESLPKIGGWIPCNEPPKHNREVLIFNGKSYSVGYYNGKTWVNAIHPVEWQEIRHDK